MSAKENDDKHKNESADSKRAPQKMGFNKFILDDICPDPLKTLQTVRPSIEQILDDCVFALDANVLLIPFEVGQTGAKEIAEIFRKLATEDKLFFPRKALQEFLRRRTDLVVKMCETLENKKSQLPASGTLNVPFLEADPEFQMLRQQESALRAAKDSYKDAINKLVLRLSDWTWDDEISKLYKEIVSQKSIVDHGMKSDDIEKDLERRTIHKIPPGFEDAKKLDGGIGDLLIWHSLLKLGKDAQKNVVFVSNERKPDWVLKALDKVVSCRPELIDEFNAKTEKHFGLIDFSRFLEIRGATRATVGVAELLELIELMDTGNDTVADTGEYDGFNPSYQQATIAIARLIRLYLTRGETFGFKNTLIPPFKLQVYVNSLVRAAERQDSMFDTHSCSSSHHSAMYQDIVDYAIRVQRLNEVVQSWRDANQTPPEDVTDELRHACHWFMDRSQEVWEGSI